METDVLSGSGDLGHGQLPLIGRAGNTSTRSAFAKQKSHPCSKQPRRPSASGRTALSRDLGRVCMRCMRGSIDTKAEDVIVFT